MSEKRKKGGKGHKHEKGKEKRNKDEAQEPTTPKNVPSEEATDAGSVMMSLPEEIFLPSESEAGSEMSFSFEKDSSKKKEKKHKKKKGENVEEKSEDNLETNDDTLSKKSDRSAREQEGHKKKTGADVGKRSKHKKKDDATDESSNVAATEQPPNTDQDLGSAKGKRSKKKKKHAAMDEPSVLSAYDELHNNKDQHLELETPAVTEAENVKPPGELSSGIMNKGHMPPEHPGRQSRHSRLSVMVPDGRGAMVPSRPTDPFEDTAMEEVSTPVIAGKKRTMSPPPESNEFKKFEELLDEEKKLIICLSQLLRESDNVEDILLNIGIIEDRNQPLTREQILGIIEIGQKLMGENLPPRRNSLPHGPRRNSNTDLGNDTTRRGSVVRQSILRRMSDVPNLEHPKEDVIETPRSPVASCGPVNPCEKKTPATDCCNVKQRFSCNLLKKHPGESAPRNVCGNVEQCRRNPGGPVCSFENEKGRDWSPPRLEQSSFFRGTFRGLGPSSLKTSYQARCTSSPPRIRSEAPCRGGHCANSTHGVERLRNRMMASLKIAIKSTEVTLNALHNNMKDIEESGSMESSSLRGEMVNYEDASFPNWYPAYPQMTDITEHLEARYRMIKPYWESPKDRSNNGIFGTNEKECHTIRQVRTNFLNGVHTQVQTPNGQTWAVQHRGGRMQAVPPTDGGTAWSQTGSHKKRLDDLSEHLAGPPNPSHREHVPYTNQTCRTHDCQGGNRDGTMNHTEKGFDHPMTSYQMTIQTHNEQNVAKPVPEWNNSMQPVDCCMDCRPKIIIQDCPQMSCQDGNGGLSCQTIQLINCHAENPPPSSTRRPRPTYSLNQMPCSLAPQFSCATSHPGFCEPPRPPPESGCSTSQPTCISMKPNGFTLQFADANNECPNEPNKFGCARGQILACTSTCPRPHPERATQQTRSIRKQYQHQSDLASSQSISGPQEDVPACNLTSFIMCYDPNTSRQSCTQQTCDPRMASPHTPNQFDMQENTFVAANQTPRDMLPRNQCVPNPQSQFTFRTNSSPASQVSCQSRVEPSLRSCEKKQKQAEYTVCFNPPYNPGCDPHGWSTCQMPNQCTQETQESNYPRSQIQVRKMIFQCPKPTEQTQCPAPCPAPRPTPCPAPCPTPCPASDQNSGPTISFCTVSCKPNCSRQSTSVKEPRQCPDDGRCDYQQHAHSSNPCLSYTQQIIMPMAQEDGCQGHRREEEGEEECYQICWT